MDENKHGYFCIANGISEQLSGDKFNALDHNVLAVIAAQSLCGGKSKREIEELCRFMQLLSSLIHTYLCD